MRKEKNKEEYNDEQNVERADQGEIKKKGK